MVSATVSVGWSGYFTSLLADLGLHLPPAFAASPGTMVQDADGSQVSAVFNLPAFAIVAYISVLLIVGVRESARVNVAIVLVKVSVVLIFHRCRRRPRRHRQLAAVHSR